MIEHSLGDIAGERMEATLSHHEHLRCALCPPAPDLLTDCGCSLDPMPCAMHRTNGEHRHCRTCGVPVFLDGHDEADGKPNYDDHECPPGFQPTVTEVMEGLVPDNACKAGML